MRFESWNAAQTDSIKSVTQLSEDAAYIIQFAKEHGILNHESGAATLFADEQSVSSLLDDLKKKYKPNQSGSRGYNLVSVLEKMVPPMSHKLTIDCFTGMSNALMPSSQEPNALSPKQRACGPNTDEAIQQ